MALINCPECGKEISDKATSCPSCGCPIEKEEMRNYHTEEYQEQKDYTVIAAQDEKKIVESKVTRGNHTAGITAIVLGAFSLLGGIFWGGGYPLVLGGFFFLAIGIGVLNSLSNDKKRIQYLQNISNGKREILICPYCKGMNVSFDAVQSGVYTSGQTARISNNINPLHPFTHTNIRTSGTHSNISYETLYICQDCGKTFKEPNKVWS